MTEEHLQIPGAFETNREGIGLQRTSLAFWQCRIPGRQHSNRTALVIAAEVTTQLLLKMPETILPAQVSNCRTLAATRQVAPQMAPVAQAHWAMLWQTLESCQRQGR